MEDVWQFCSYDATVFLQDGLCMHQASEGVISHELTVLFCDLIESHLDKMLKCMLIKFLGMVVDTEAHNFRSVKMIC